MHLACRSLSRKPWRAPPPPATWLVSGPARTQTLGVREWGLCFRPRQPLPLVVHTEGLPTVPIPLAGSVQAILVTLQAHLIPLTVGDTWNPDRDTAINDG